MIPWRLVIGALIGAIVVKEPKKAGRFYDSARAGILAAVRKVRRYCRGEGEPSGPAPEGA